MPADRRTVNDRTRLAPVRGWTTGARFDTIGPTTQARRESPATARTRAAGAGAEGETARQTLRQTGLSVPVDSGERSGCVRAPTGPAHGERAMRTVGVAPISQAKGQRGDGARFARTGCDRASASHRPREVPRRCQSPRPLPSAPRRPPTRCRAPPRRRPSRAAPRCTPSTSPPAAGSSTSPAWTLPIAYGSQLDEHRAVREAAGMFDVSHMTNVEVAGPRATAWLRGLLSGDVAKLDPRPGALRLPVRRGRRGDRRPDRLPARRRRATGSSSTRRRGTRTSPGSSRTARTARSCGCSTTGCCSRCRGRRPWRRRARRWRTSSRSCPISPPCRASARSRPSARSSAAPATPARTGWRSRSAAMTASRPGRRSPRRAFGRAVSVRATRCGSRPACACTARTSTRNTRRSSPASAGRWTSPIPRASSSVARRSRARPRAARASVGSACSSRAAASRAAGYPVEVDGAGVGSVTSGGFSPTLGRSIALARVGTDAAVDACDVMVRARARRGASREGAVRA